MLAQNDGADTLVSKLILIRQSTYGLARCVSLSDSENLFREKLGGIDVLTSRMTQLKGTPMLLGHVLEIRSTVSKPEMIRPNTSTVRKLTWGVVHITRMAHEQTIRDVSVGKEPRQAMSRPDLSIVADPTIALRGISCPQPTPIRSFCAPPEKFWGHPFVVSDNLATNRVHFDPPDCLYDTSGGVLCQ
ncbi:MAG: hypothetical protein Q7O66_04010 [Dehalococcoidia bacterium]|nr:hypothetical protein [Dehalococcoidia bacterium]